MTNIIQSNLSQIQKLTKYILMGLIVMIAIKYIPENMLQTKEIIMIGATSSITFAILDMVSPSIKVTSQIKSSNSTQEKPEVKSEKVLVEA
jgi:hypothetical protein